MHKCSSCGAEYNSNFLQCPQCGSSRYTEVIKKSGYESAVGVIITLIIVLGLSGLIGYGAYIYMHPFDDGPIITDLDPNDYTTTTTTTTTVASTSGTTTSGGNGSLSARSTIARTTTVKLEGQPYSNNSHVLTVPNGYSVSSDYASMPYNYQDVVGADAILLVNNSNKSINYSINTKSGNYLSDNSLKTYLVDSLDSLGFNNIIPVKLYGRSYYYSIEKETKVNGYTNGVLLMSKDNKTIFATFSIPTSEINEESMLLLTQIINTYI